jgi:hypothetical protein
MSFATLATYANNRLTPVQYPEDARWTAGVFDVNLTLARGTVIANKGTNQTLVAFDTTNTASVGLLMYDIKTDANGQVYFGGSTTAGPENVPFDTAPYFVAGTFDVADLTGLDATSRANLNGRLLANGFFKF